LVEKQKLRETGIRRFNLKVPPGVQKTNQAEAKANNFGRAIPIDYVVVSGGGISCSCAWCALVVIEKAKVRGL
jgi:hypothetical protein